MSFVVGACQLEDIQGDTTAALEKVLHYAKLADNQGVDTLCFPECFLQGYTLEAGETKQRALSLSSPAFKDILDKLSARKVTIILGLIEQDNGIFYNTAAIIQKGKLLGTYRKVHLFEPNFQPGDDYPIFSSNGVRFGVNICYDARFSEGAKALGRQGAQIIFYPLNNRLPPEKAANYRHKHIPNLVARAKETGRWIVSADVVAHDATHIGYGHTAIVNPEGDVVRKAKELQQQLIIMPI